MDGMAQEVRKVRSNIQRNEVEEPTVSNCSSDLHLHTQVVSHTHSYTLTSNKQQTTNNNNNNNVQFDFHMQSW